MSIASISMLIPLILMIVIGWGFLALIVYLVVLLIKAILDQPTRWENFLPAIAAFALSVLLGWIF